MKKLLIGVTISAAVFGGFVLAQSMNSGSAAKQETASTKLITAQEAKDIALKEVNGTITESDYDGDDNRPHYEFEIQSNNEEVSVEVDAETGKATVTEREAMKAPAVNEKAQGTDGKAVAAQKETAAVPKEEAKQNVAVTQSEGKQKEVITQAEVKQEAVTKAEAKQKEVITKAEAINIAKTVAKGTVTKVELDNDDDDQSQKYELEFKDGKVEYDVEVDALTGKILEVDQELED